MAAILDFEVNVKLFEVDVKNMTEGRGGKEGRGPGSVFYVDTRNDSAYVLSVLAVCDALLLESEMMECLLHL